MTFASDVVRAFRAPPVRHHVSLLAVVAAGMFASACSDDVRTEEPLTAASTDAITVIAQSDVKRQSIGNCWLYATASWAESMHLAATEESVNLSESYWTYWHWFDQIANGGLYGKNEISTGGSYGTAAEIIQRYGYMREGDFLPGEALAEMSRRQDSALKAINRSLSDGALKDWSSRYDRALVRRELDRAFGLDEAVVLELDAVFGEAVDKTLDNAYRDAPLPEDVRVHHARDFAVRTADPALGELRTASLSDALGQRLGYSRRSGPLAWSEVSYPYSAAGRRAFEKRIQRAMHAGLPVIISWFVDFNALDEQGRFFGPPETPGRQGGHVTVLDDYQATNVPGFGPLYAGEDETRPEALAAALEDEVEIEFFRVKNSWGASRLDRKFVVPGYHDLYSAYLRGPIARCPEKDGKVDTTQCSPMTPFWSVVLPPGY